MRFLTKSTLSYTIKSWDKSQVEPGTMPRLNLGPGRRPRLNLGNIPAIAGKTKLGQFPAIAGKKTCYSRDLSWEYISLLQLVMVPAIARYITRPPNAFITAYFVRSLLTCTLLLRVGMCSLQFDYECWTFECCCLMFFQFTWLLLDIFRHCCIFFQSDNDTLYKCQRRLYFTILSAIERSSLNSLYILRKKLYIKNYILKTIY